MERCANLMLVWTILTIYATVYHPHNDTEPRYTPKSQRWTMMKYVGWLKSWVKGRTRRLADKTERFIMELHTRKRRRYVQRIVKKHSRKTATWGRLRHSLTILACGTLIAAQASDAMEDIHFSYDTDAGLVGVDNRCSACISHDSDDFIGPLEDSNRVIKGYGGTRTTGVKTGTIKWQWEDDQGQVHSHVIPNSYYVPSGKVRLLSPQHWAKERNKNNKRDKDAGEKTNHKEVQLQWANGQHTKTIPLDPNNNVATFRLAPGFTKFQAFCVEIKNDDKDPITLETIVTDDEGDDIPEREKYTTHDLQGPVKKKDQLPNVVEDEEDVADDEEERQPTHHTAEMLDYHYRFAHISFKRIQDMARWGILPRRLAKCPIPICTACMYGKATKRPWRQKSSRNRDESSKPKQPGECVSVDQMHSPTPGLVAQVSGTLTTKRYKVATIFVDQYSGYSYVHLQESTGAEETVRGKEAFERHMASMGVKVQHYHADNGVFRSRLWEQHCYDKRQGLTFAGVNAHHQNGMAERRIRLLQELTRTSMIQAQRRWPDAITTNLWPYAMKMANEAHNATPNPKSTEGYSPLQMVSKSKVATNPKHWRHFGCPVYVVEADLQGNKGIFHKWRDRATLGVYLGRSPQHSRSVGLVLDLKTGLVSPQFHLKYDRMFQTVRGKTTESEWQTKAGFMALPEKGKQANQGRSKRPGSTREHRRKATPRRNETPRQEQQDQQQPTQSIDNLPSPREEPVQEDATRPSTRIVGEEIGQGSIGPSTDNRQTNGQEGRSTQATETRPVVRYWDSEGGKSPSQRLVEAINSEEAMAEENGEQEVLVMSAITPIIDIMEQEEPLLAFKASSDPDTMYLHEAMRQPDREKFQKAMLKEVTDMYNAGVFQIVDRSTVPEGVTVLPSVWALKRKRHRGTGEIKKYKARLNIDGSRMIQGEHYDLTYAPVATWGSVRLLLTLVLLHGWQTQQIDYIQAYTQAPPERDLYMKIPKGLDVDGDPAQQVFRMDKNVYGNKAAGRIWNKYLVSKLKSIGFEQSKIDECIFYKGRTIYLLYTDDSILAGPDEQEIEDIYKQMQEAGLKVTKEGKLDDFLGVNIERKEDNTIHLTQPTLIKSVLEDLRLLDDKVNPKPIPMKSSTILSRHLDSPKHDDSFHYRSVIGKLGYIEKGSRPDIAYPTHQCARFCSDPRELHARAIRWLGRYLKGTADKGTILKPDKTRGLEVFVDSDFAGNWDKKIAAQDPDTARSRYGYIIMYAGCPIVWKTHLAQEICLSTTEAEYTGLSYALREAIPMIELLKELEQYNIHSTLTMVKEATTEPKELYKKNKNRKSDLDRQWQTASTAIPRSPKYTPTHSDTSTERNIAPTAMDHTKMQRQIKPTVYCKVFEDNSGCVEMARFPKARPRTKHLNVKLHHFRSWVESGAIQIIYIPTEHQPADYLSKPLAFEPLTTHRRAVQGW